MGMKLFLFAVIFAGTIQNSYQDDIVDVAFVNIGSYMKADSHSVFYLSRYFRTGWHSVRAICQSYGMEFLTLDSQNKKQNFIEAIKRREELFNAHDWVSVGAISSSCKSNDLWYWVDTGKKANFAFNWVPGDPNCSNDSETCLTVGKHHIENVIGFADSSCNDETHRFFCEKIIKDE